MVVCLLYHRKIRTDASMDVHNLISRFLYHYSPSTFYLRSDIYCTKPLFQELESNSAIAGSMHHVDGSKNSPIRSRQNSYYKFNSDAWSGCTSGIIPLSTSCASVDSQKHHSTIDLFFIIVVISRLPDFIHSRCRTSLNHEKRKSPKHTPIAASDNCRHHLVSR